MFIINTTGRLNEPFFNLIGGETIKIPNLLRQHACYVRICQNKVLVVRILHPLINFLNLDIAFTPRHEDSIRRS